MLINICEYRIKPTGEETVYILLYSQPNLPESNYTYRFAADKLDEGLFMIVSKHGPFVPVIILDEKEDRVYIEYKGNVLEELNRSGQGIIDAYALINANSITVNPYYPGGYLEKGNNGEYVKFGMESKCGNLTSLITNLYVSPKWPSKTGRLSQFTEFEIKSSDFRGEVLCPPLPIKDLAHNIMNKKYGKTLNFTLRSWIVIRCGKIGYTFIKNRDMPAA